VLTERTPSRLLAICRNSWRLTLGSVPQAIRFAARAPSFGARPFRSGVEYAVLCLRCLAEIVASKFGLRRPGVPRARLLGLGIRTFHLSTLLSLTNEIFLDNLYSVNATSAHAARILDCGSNIGVSVLFFKKRFPDCEVIAFEPDPATYELLRANIAENSLTKVVVHNMALGGRDRSVKFCNEPATPGSLRMRVVNQSATWIEVPCVRLSPYIGERVDLLKIDIEGAETEVLAELAGARALTRIERIILEYHHHITSTEDRFSELLQTLEQNGFGYYVDGEIGKHTQELHVYGYRKLSLGPTGELAGFASVSRTMVTPGAKQSC
jgi:FkbM family methyltransferase